MGRKLSKDEFIRLYNETKKKLRESAYKKYERLYDREMARHEKKLSEIRAILTKAEKEADEAGDRLETEWWNGLTEEERHAEIQSWKRG